MEYGKALRLILPKSAFLMPIMPSDLLFLSATYLNLPETYLRFLGRLGSRVVARYLPIYIGEKKAAPTHGGGLPR